MIYRHFPTLSLVVFGQASLTNSQATNDQFPHGLAVAKLGVVNNTRSERDEGGRLERQVEPHARVFRYDEDLPVDLA